MKDFQEFIDSVWAEDSRLRKQHEEEILEKERSALRKAFLQEKIKERSDRFDKIINQIIEREI